jgi:hypothetical protein
MSKNIVDQIERDAARQAIEFAAGCHVGSKEE